MVSFFFSDFDQKPWTIVTRFDQFSSSLSLQPQPDVEGHAVLCGVLLQPSLPPGRRLGEQRRRPPCQPSLRLWDHRRHGSGEPSTTLDHRPSSRELCLQHHSKQRGRSHFTTHTLHPHPHSWLHAALFRTRPGHRHHISRRPWSSRGAEYQADLTAGHYVHTPGVPSTRQPPQWLPSLALHDRAQLGGGPSRRLEPQCRHQAWHGGHRRVLITGAVRDVHCPRRCAQDPPGVPRAVRRPLLTSWSCVLRPVSPRSYSLDAGVCFIMSCRDLPAPAHVPRLPPAL